LNYITKLSPIATNRPPEIKSPKIEISPGRIEKGLCYVNSLALKS